VLIRVRVPKRLFPGCGIKDKNLLAVIVGMAAYSFFVDQRRLRRNFLRLFEVISRNTSAAL
jgi:hypothetical protein